MKSKIKSVIDKKGKKTGVLMKVKDFKKLMEKLEDFEDLETVYEITSKNFKTIPYEDIRTELFGKNATKK